MTHSLLTQLQDELTLCQNALARVEKELLHAPQGRLEISPRPCGSFQYYHMQTILADDKCKKTLRTYLARNKISIVYALAQKEYNQLVKKALTKELSAVSALVEILQNSNPSAVYDNLSPTRQSLVSPLQKTKESLIQEFYLNYPGNQNPYPMDITYQTEQGTCVRSKSEKIIGDLLERNNIPYVYEAKIQLKNGESVYPDFLLFNSSTNQIFLYEHFGKMDDLEYQSKTLNKIMIYQQNGYWFGENLLYSFESSTLLLNTKLILSMLSKYLLS